MYKAEMLPEQLEVKLMVQIRSRTVSRAAPIHTYIRACKFSPKSIQNEHLTKRRHLVSRKTTECRLYIKQLKKIIGFSALHERRCQTNKKGTKVEHAYNRGPFSKQTKKQIVYNSSYISSYTSCNAV